MLLTPETRKFDTTAFRFLTKSEYLEDLVSRISKTKRGDRIVVASMTFNPSEEPIHNLMDALCAAASRGVRTGLLIDARSVPIMKKVPVSRNSQAHFQAIDQALQELEAHGGVYAITNESLRRLINPFSGRSHIKTAIINDVVYVGGCNLATMMQIDMMVSWRDSMSADWLYDRIQAILDHKHTARAFSGNDQVWQVDNITRLLLDSGSAYQSGIFQEALSLIDDSQEWLVMTCQYFPSGLTAQHLTRAYRRGVKVSVYYNHPAKLTSGLYYDHPTGPGLRTIVHHIVHKREQQRHPSVLFQGQLRKDIPYLHAKLIATEQGAIIGSHNYISAGVKLGTAELALVRHDGTFAHRAVQNLTRQLAQYQ